MTRRWLATAVLLVALAGCGDVALAGCADDRAEPAAVAVPAAGAPVESPAPVGSADSRPATRAATTHAATPRATGTTAAAGGDGQTDAGSGSKGLDDFVTVVRAKVPEVAVDRRDEEIEAIAQQACASLAAGKKADALVAETRSLGTADAQATDQATARELINLAIDTVCSAQRRRVDEF
jgi:hypothetical protein